MEIHSCLKDNQLVYWNANMFFLIYMYLESKYPREKQVFDTRFVLDTKGFIIYSLERWARHSACGHTE